MRRRRSLRIFLRYALHLAREFRWTIAALAVVLVLGAVMYGSAPVDAFRERPPADRLMWSVLAAWMNLFGEPMAEANVWYLAVIQATFPILGFVLIGEGVVRLGMLMFSRRHGEKEWMMVMASTYRNHIIVCGLGHLGIRLLDHLVRQQQELVVVERDANCPYLGRAKECGVPVLVRDMREDQALRDAGLADARAIVVASNDDLANIEVALDARRINPGVRVLLRLFDQRIADKFKDAGIIDEAFSSAALAAPAVAEMVMRSAGGPAPAADR